MVQEFGFGQNLSQNPGRRNLFRRVVIGMWGAVCNSVSARGPWTTLDKSKHINELELLGALFALESFLGDAVGLSVRLFFG